MRQRLFWKILIGFWITFIAMVEGLWVLAILYGSPPRPLSVIVDDKLAPIQIAAAAEALRLGGLPGYQEMRDGWPEEDRARVSVTPAGGSSATGVKDGDIVAEATGLDGKAYRIVYHTGTVVSHRKRPSPFYIPPEVLALGVVGGLFFSATLAWYLSKPVRLLRNGFDRLAGGELEVRLRPGVGRRRDEIADLARDFDAMAERLQQLVTSREQLLHNVSHELRSPLARLHMAVGLARQNAKNIPAALDRFELESQRLDDIVGEVLSLSRADSGAIEFDDYFDLDQLVLSVVDDARFEAQSSRTRIVTNVEDAADEAGRTIRGNAPLMRRALDNIVRNALRFSPPDTTIEVAVEADRADGDCVIRVSDQGPGMRGDALKTAFEPFVRGPEGAAGHGFGLGLAIARRAVVMHGGSITAENRPNGGLEVVIRLPRHRGTAPA